MFNFSDFLILFLILLSYLLVLFLLFFVKNISDNSDNFINCRDRVIKLSKSMTVPLSNIFFTRKIEVKDCFMFHNIIFILIIKRHYLMHEDN